MNFLRCILVATLVATQSCTLDKTDYEAETRSAINTENVEKEAFSIIQNGHKISVLTMNGVFRKGFNSIRVKITDSQTQKEIQPSEVVFTPTYNGKNSPHSEFLTKNDEGIFEGFSVFYDENEYPTHWDFSLKYKIDNREFSVEQEILVENQTNKNLNMTAFTGNDGKEYIIALIAPFKPKVSENELVAGIFRKKSNGWEILPNHILRLDPRMPEPSMGNHSSPNNKDLTQGKNGWYYGVVNYTMTGDWTLNFILENGQVIKGTKVPEEHSPGVEGKKSELFIDILF